MGRLFEEHKIRRQRSLCGRWLFAKDPQDLGEREGWQRGLCGGKGVFIPSVWNLERGMLSYEGVAFYEKKFYTGGGTLRFVFEGVMTEARVYLDGELLGSHYGGFTAFDLIARGVTEGEHTLSVRVDNRFDADSIPQARVDWYHFGGITREVCVEELSGIVIRSMRVEYELSEGLDRAECSFALELYCAAECETTDRIRVSLGGETAEKEVTVSAGESRCVRIDGVTLRDIRLWDVGAPELYYAEAASSTDDLTDRVGFRLVEVKDGCIYLNKKEIEIRGVNRHEEHPDFGMAFPKERMDYDLDLIEDMGCNSVRGSHYPNSWYMLDLLDERGLLFWSEIPIWGCGFSTETLGNPTVVERGAQMHREMVAQYYNHPSVIIWGMHNEINAHTAEGYKMTECYHGILRAEGGNRAIVYAANHPLEDISLEFSDIICVNKYCGWYEGDAESWLPFLDKFRARLSELGLSDRPVIMSEFGGAALYGFHDAEKSRWSEEYQAELIARSLDIFHSDEMVKGYYVWQFADIRTAEEMGYTRARGFNNKGLVNENRRPKAAYYAVKSCYERFKSEGENRS